MRIIEQYAGWHSTVYRVVLEEREKSLSSEELINIADDPEHRWEQRGVKNHFGGRVIETLNPNEVYITVYTD